MKTGLLTVIFVALVVAVVVAGGPTTRYGELKTSGNLSLMKNTAPAEGDEQGYTLIQKRYDSQTGTELEPINQQVTKEGLLRSRAGLQAQIDAIDAVLADIDKINTK